MRRSGFTILELLVASLLLSMLVTVLTMIFNQSSIAWRTGIAAERDLGSVRRSLGTYHDIEDDVLPGLGDTGGGGSRTIKYRTVSVFSRWNGSGSPQTDTGRLFEPIKWDGVGSFSESSVLTPAPQTLTGDNPRGGDAFIVGVRSAGPDTKWDTEDDISTYPEDVK